MVNEALGLTPIVPTPAIVIPLVDPVETNSFSNLAKIIRNSSSGKQIH